MFPRAQQGLITRDVDEGLLVHDERAGKVHLLNRTAGRVLRLCDGTHAAAEIAGTLACEGGIAFERASFDVDAVLANFARLGLLA